MMLGEQRTQESWESLQDRQRPGGGLVKRPSCWNTECIPVVRYNVWWSRVRIRNRPASEHLGVRGGVNDDVETSSSGSRTDAGTAEIYVSTRACVKEGQ